MPEKVDAQTELLLQEIGIAIKTYVETAKLTGKWLGHTVGVFDLSRKTHWRPFAAGQRDIALLSSLAATSSELGINLSDISKKLFTESDGVSECHPYLTAEPLKTVLDKKSRKPAAQLEILDMVGALQKLGTNQRDADAKFAEYFKELISQAKKFRPFLIPLVQVDGSRTKLSGAVVIYLAPEPEVLCHLPVFKAIGLPLLEIHKHKYGLLPNRQENLEQFMLDLLLEVPESDPHFKETMGDFAIDQHSFDWRLSGRLSGTIIEPCIECSKMEEVIAECEDCIKGAVPSLCQACDKAWHFLAAKCPWKCWTTIKELFYSDRSEAVNPTKLVPINTLAKFLGFKNFSGNREIFLPSQPGILPLLALKRIHASIGTKTPPKLVAMRGGGAAVIFPLDPAKYGKGGKTGLRDRFYARGAKVYGNVRGNTALDLWHSMFRDLSQYRARYPVDGLRSEKHIDRILGPQDIPLFSVNFLPDAVQVMWLGK